MGLYYAGGIDWTFTDKPIRTMTDLMANQGLGENYARYVAEQWKELIDRYQPDILWNDMGFPAESDPNLFAHYYNTVETGAVNDRWAQTDCLTIRSPSSLPTTYRLDVAPRCEQRAVPEQKRNHYDFETGIHRWMLFASSRG
jgi:alpha-L-fucosidase